MSTFTLPVSVHALRKVRSTGISEASAHRGLIVASALAGALLLVVADLLARTLASPVEIPVGAITALVGAPIFFVLLRRTRADQGGWG